MSPALTEANPMVSRALGPVYPWRANTPCSSSVRSKDFAITSPIFNAVPDGASTLAR